MDEELDYDMLNHFNELIRVTLKISNYYKSLIMLEVFKKNNLNYNEIKDELINKLSSLLLIEEDIYNYFSMNYFATSTALDYLEDNYKFMNHKMSNFQILSFTRIKNKLSKIELYQDIENNDEKLISDIKSLKKYQVLKLDNLNDSENIYMYLELYYSFSNSLNMTYAGVLLNEMHNSNDTTLLIKMLYEESFASSSDLEKELIKNRFNKVPNASINTYNMSEDTFKSFINLELSDLISDLLNKINTIKEHNELNQSIILFITCLLYLNKNELNKVTNLVKRTIKNEEIKNELIHYINNIEIYKPKNNNEMHI